MIIHVSGTPYEMGVAHGKQAAELIPVNLGLVKDTVDKAGMPWPIYNKYLARNIKYLEKYQPDFIEEFQGIADGCGMTLLDIAMINITLYFMAKTLPRECSTFIARGDATLDHKTYIAKTRDMGTGSYKHVVLHRHYDGFETTEVHAAGIVTYPGSGLNSYGLATSQTGMWSPYISFDTPPLDTECALDSDLLNNQGVILKNCKNVDDVIAFVKDAKYLHGVNLFAADTKRAVVFEIMIDEKQMFEDENGILVRANHFLHPSYKDIIPKPDGYPSTHCRYQRGMSFLTERHGQIRFQDMLQLISDHENGGGCICRHGGEAKGYTSYGSICVPEDGQIWTSFGNPCQSLVLDSIEK